MPSIIIVPPSPSRERRYWRPRWMFSGVASRGVSPRREALIEKEMSWNESPGWSRRKPRWTAALACSIGRPDMLPEQSRTNTSSSGCRFSVPNSSGG